MNSRIKLGVFEGDSRRLGLRRPFLILAQGGAYDGAAIKFLHASDLHLDRAMSGLAEVPPHLKSTMVNAPYLAAENIFQLAVSEKVDFVLLAGDVVDLDAGGPRAAAFLLNHFERLAERDIRVYWCNGKVDQPDRWPAAASLPENVVTFTSTGFEESVCRKNGQPIASIYGAGFYSSRNVAARYSS